MSKLDDRTRRKVFWVMDRGLYIHDCDDNLAIARSMKNKYFVSFHDNTASDMLPHIAEWRLLSTLAAIGIRGMSYE